ncbi:MAG: carboxypeptidase regulatory-like domain-containing protein [Candidatus Binatia bacterium]
MARRNVRSFLPRLTLLLAVWTSGLGCDGGPGVGLFSDEIRIEPGLLGTVTDAVTREPVGGALVQFQNRSTFTSSTGAYSFDNVRTGTDVVTVSRGGYLTAERQATIDYAYVNYLDVELEPVP